MSELSLVDYGFKLDIAVTEPKAYSEFETESPSQKLGHAIDVLREDFDNKPKCKGDTSAEPERFAVCGDCYRWRKIIPSCGQRNCPRCQLKQSRRLMEKYVPALGNVSTGYGRRWIAVTLSGYRIAKGAVGQNVFMFSTEVRDFLKEVFPLGGLIVVEHTFEQYEKQYYIHAHALVLGDFMDIRELEKRWGNWLFESGLIDADTERWAWLSDMRRDKQKRLRSNFDAVKAGLTYILKYVSKGVALEDDELDQVKGLRYISTYGELYNMRLPAFRSVCKFCKGPVGLCSGEDIDAIIKEGMSKGDEPLEIERVISWPTKQPKRDFEAEERRDQELKEWFNHRWDGISIAVGGLLNMKWLFGETALLKV
jgi:hypothetical protein